MHTFNAHVNSPGALYPFYILWKMKKLEVRCFSEMHRLREKPKATAIVIFLLAFPQQLQLWKSLRADCNTRKLTQNRRKQSMFLKKLQVPSRNSDSD